MSDQVRVLALVVLLATVVAFWVWALRHWLLRTWRTVALLVVATLALVGGPALSSEPIVWVLSAVVAFASIWVVLLGHRFLWAMGAADYEQVQSLQRVDAAAAETLSTVDETNVAAAVTALRSLINELDRSQASEWDRVRELKLRELHLAVSVLTRASDDPESDIAQQGLARTEAREEFMRVRRARTSFW